MKQYAEKQKRRTLIIAILLFLLLTISIIAVGYKSYRNFEAQSHAEAEVWLSAIENSKLSGLADWRGNLLKYANSIYKNRSFSDSVALYLKDNQDGEARGNILNWLMAYQENDELSGIYLLDEQGTTMLSVPDVNPMPASAITKKIPEVLKSGQITFVDFYRDEFDGHVYTTILIPILDNHTQRAMGFLALRVDPQVRLYPYLAQPITNTMNIQSFLVRREGNDTVFLNPLKFNSEAALDLRFPVTETESLAVKAAQGQTGILEGTDYRGVAMIADIQPVPDPPWWLVTHIEVREVYDPVNENFRSTVVVTGTIIFYSGLGAVLVWRQRQLKYYQSEAEAAEILRATEDELRLLTRELDNKVRERTEQLEKVNQNLLEEKQRAEFLVEDLQESREQLRALSQQMVDLQEKQIKTLARELHDSIGQNLTAININLSLIQQLLPNKSSEDIKTRLADTSHLVEETVARMRNVIADFLPPMLESYGLAPALAWYGEQFTKRTNIRAQVNDRRSAAPRPSPEVEIGLFRIVQEALNNVAKHSCASQADIELKDDDDDMLMTISDNGVGFDPQAVFASPAHWGFAIMRERATALNASFDVWSAPGKGVKITLRIAK